MTVEGGPTVSTGGETSTDTGAEPRPGSSLVGHVISNCGLDSISGCVDVLSPV